MSWGGRFSGYEPTAFLFSITNSFKHTQTPQAVADHASIWTYETYGPMFGMGDLGTGDLRGRVNIGLGYWYNCRVGQSPSAECNRDFAGPGCAFEFGPHLLELEVYADQ